MKTRYSSIIVVLITAVACIMILGGETKPVHAATCTWNGYYGNNWHNTANWTDCGAGLPGASDDVVIPDMANDPVIYSGIWGTAVNSIVIQENAQLTLKGYSELCANTWDNYGTVKGDFDNDHTYANIKGSTSWPYSGTFNNHSGGTIITDNSGSYWYDLHMYTTFDNDGLVDLNGTFTSYYHGSLILRQGGSHDGTFTGESDTKIVVGYSDTPGKTNDFNGSVSIPNMLIQDNATVNFSGQYLPASTDSYLYVFEGCELNFTETATVYMPEDVSISGTLSLPDEFGEVDIYKLQLSGNTAEIINEGEISVTNEFTFHGGTLSGSGKTIISSTTTKFHLLFGTMKLDGQELRNSATAFWRTGTINLINGAVIENYGTFGANDNSTMNGDATSSFHNNINSHFEKLSPYSPGSITTMNIDFVNNGTIDVIAGTLIFNGDLTAGDGTVIDLDEEQFQGETLTILAGAYLKGSGTVDGDLENAGYVQPGDSPGIISVTGDYTQDQGGLLYMEIGGTTPGAQYDQLAVTGTADLDGTLYVYTTSFTPDYGQTFTLMTYASHIGTFSTVNLPALPDDLEWTLEYGSTALLLKMPPAPPEVSLNSATYNIGESGGTVTITANLNISSDTTITVDYATSNGTATAGEDYTATCGTLIFIPDDTSESFTVPITSDLFFERNEDFTITLSNPSEAILGTPSSAQVTIIDDDDPPAITLSSATYSIGEAEPFVTITVEISGLRQMVAEVDYYTYDGSATAGSDYTPASGTLTFTPTDASKTFNVSLIDDATYEGDETFNIDLCEFANASTGEHPSAQVTIIEDDMQLKYIFLPLMMH